MEHSKNSVKKEDHSNLSGVHHEARKDPTK